MAIKQPQDHRKRLPTRAELERAGIKTLDAPKEQDPPQPVHVTLVWTVGGQRIGDAQFDALPDPETGAITMPLDAEQLVAILAPAIQVARQQQRRPSGIIVPGPPKVPAELTPGGVAEDALRILKLQD